MKTRTCWLLMALAAVVLVACAGSPPGAGTATLDGSSFDIVLEMPGEQPEKDTINFAAGKFESAVCTPLGFPKWTPYQAREAGGAIEFTVITRHPAGTIMDWKGAARGDSITGTVVRTLEGKVSTGNFKGSRRR